ncbi:hypothetical protein GOP47_0001295, partial [Adiantum capillus-veneris]
VLFRDFKPKKGGVIKGIRTEWEEIYRVPIVEHKGTDRDLNAPCGANTRVRGGSL